MKICYEIHFTKYMCSMYKLLYVVDEYIYISLVFGFCHAGIQSCEFHVML